jgi:tetratricopeptide (TPR) repeat protein
LLPSSLGLIAGCLVPGWTKDQPQPNPTAEANISASAKITPEKDLPKRPPQAMTCVAFGKLHLESARDGNRPQAQQRELYETARQYFQQAIKTDPKCTDAYHGLVRAYEGVGDHARVLETYQKAQKAFPKEAAFHYELGMYQARRKDWNSSLPCLTKATELAPENRTYANMLGFCLARMGRYDESMAWFTKTVGEAQAHYNLARVLHHVKQEDACKRHLKQALAIQPGHKEAQDFLAQIESPRSAVETAGHTSAPPPPPISSGFAADK